jgi:hypothetical protein
MKNLNELIGRRLVCIRPMTKLERSREGWDPESHSASSVLVFDNDMAIYASSDDEGNEAGTLFGNDGKQDFYVWTDKEIREK